MIVTPLTNISYPLALDEVGNAVFIKEARHGGLFYCQGCSQVMSAKQGRLRAWHFAHKPPYTLVCDSDLVLHRTAQELILSGFRNAVAQSGEYLLGRLCDDCNNPVTFNVAKVASVINREVSVVARTRSDLVVTHADRKQLVIEVVHTHDLDESAATAYSQSGIPVLKIRPVWLPQDDGPTTVASEPGLDGLSLDAGALAYDALNVGPCLCAEHKRREREEAARQAQGNNRTPKPYGRRRKYNPLLTEAAAARQRWELEEERLQLLKQKDRKAYIAELYRIASEIQSRR